MRLTKRHQMSLHPLMTLERLGSFARFVQPIVNADELPNPQRNLNVKFLHENMFFSPWCVKSEIT